MDPASVELAGLASDVTRPAPLGHTDQDANTNVIVPLEDRAISLQVWHLSARCRGLLVSPSNDI